MRNTLFKKAPTILKAINDEKQASGCCFYDCTFIFFCISRQEAKE